MMGELNGISEFYERSVTPGDIALGSPAMAPQRSAVLNNLKKKSRIHGRNIESRKCLSSNQQVL